MRVHVYLAGPILDRTEAEANDWRYDAQESLETRGMQSVSPLRCEPLQGVYSTQSADPLFGTARAIASKNFMDVQRCDVTLCFMPKVLNDKRLSLGTLIELAWAHALHKPTILITDDPLLIEHPLVQANANWIVPTLEDGIDVVTGLFSVYS